jgi:hypothetical protein
VLARSPFGTIVLGALMVIWVAIFLAFLLFRFRQDFFGVVMGALAVVYGLAIVVFRDDASDLFSRWSTNRIMFSNSPRYRPGYLAFIGGAFAVFGGLLFLTSLRHLAG